MTRTVGGRSISITTVALHLFTLATVCVGCEPKREPAPADNDVSDESLTVGMRTPGCYYLENGAWQSDSAIARYYDVSRLPRKFRFDTTPMIGSDFMQDAAKSMKRITSEFGGPFEFWQANHSQQSLFVGQVMPLGGVSMTLHPVAGGLAGELTASTDAVKENEASSASVPVQLRSISCDSSTLR